MSTDLLEMVFRIAFDPALDPEDIHTPNQDHLKYGPRPVMRERINRSLRPGTSPEERAYNERRDLEDTFGVYDYQLEMGDIL